MREKVSEHKLKLTMLVPVLDLAEIPTLGKTPAKVAAEVKGYNKAVADFHASQRGAKDLIESAGGVRNGAGLLTLTAKFHAARFDLLNKHLALLNDAKPIIEKVIEACKVELSEREAILRRTRGEAESKLKAAGWVPPHGGKSLWVTNPTAAERQLAVAAGNTETVTTAAEQVNEAQSFLNGLQARLRDSETKRETETKLADLVLAALR